MSNDIVNRRDVLRELAPFRGYIPDKYLDKLIEIMSWLPPAEQPMSAVDFLYHRERMKNVAGFPSPRGWLPPSRCTLSEIIPSIEMIEQAVAAV